MIEVEQIENTCFACPSQWAGVGKNGEDIYIRYRWGMLKLYVNDKIITQKMLGDGYDGCLDYSSMQENLKRFLNFDNVIYKKLKEGEDE